MSFIEIITDAKSQSQLSKSISKEIVNNCDLMFVKEKNIENIKNIKLETIILNQQIENPEVMKKVIENSKNVITNEDVNFEIEFKNNQKVISYGYSSKSDITISSIREEEALICLQNEIHSIYGRIIEPQELKVNIKADTNIYNIMIIIALTTLYTR